MAYAIVLQGIEKHEINSARAVVDNHVFPTQNFTAILKYDSDSHAIWQ